MKIGIDARLWNETGVGRYIRNIVLNLEEVDKKNSYVLFVTKKDFNDVKGNIKNNNWKIVEANSRWHSASEQFEFPRLLKKENLDLVHFPYFSVPFFYNEPFVVTIHDLILHHYPTGQASTLPLWLYGFKMIAYRLVVNNAARKSKRTIAVSKSTKEEIIDHLWADKSKVEVVYEAADDFKDIKEEKMDLNNYLLYVGNVYPHKNVDKLLKAFEKLIEKNTEVKLVFVCKEDYFSKRLKKQLKDLIKKERVTFVEDSNDQKLAYLYKNAIALVRPSLMEGFSLPPLEAMAKDCLVLLSDIPVHREIFKDAALYFNPNDVNEINIALAKALQMSAKEKEEYINKGKKISSSFSWRDAALETLKVYESSVSI